MGGSCGLYGFLFFLPIILKNSFGYSQVASFCLTAPPAAFAIVVVLAISWIADKTRVRGPYAVLECIIAVVGLAMTGFLKSATPRYIGTFLGVAGTTALIATSLAWGQNNIRSDARRNVVTVIQIVNAAVGGIYSALVFRQQVRLWQLFRILCRDNHNILILLILGFSRLPAGSHRYGCPALARCIFGHRHVVLPLEGQQEG